MKLKTLFLLIGSAFLLNPLPNSKATVVINEVAPAENRIEFLNTGDSTVDISTWWLCSLIRYARINDTTRVTVVSGSTNMEPGAFLVVETSSSYDLADSAADLGLYTTSAFSSSSAMEDFVQWGSGSNGRISVANAKGIWTPGTFLPSPAAGESIIFNGQEVGAGGWSLTDSPSFGSGNGAGGEIPQAESAAAFFGERIADSLIEGWSVDQTLGPVFVEQFPWVFHPNLGWFFALGETASNDVFLFVPGLGWHFTRLDEAFPYLYDLERQSWVFFGVNDSVPELRYFFDFASNEWITPDPIPQP